MAASVSWLVGKEIAEVSVHELLPCCDSPISHLYRLPFADPDNCAGRSHVPCDNWRSQNHCKDGEVPGHAKVLLEENRSMLYNAGCSKEPKRSSKFKSPPSPAGLCQCSYHLGMSSKIVEPPLRLVLRMFGQVATTSETIAHTVQAPTGRPQKLNWASHSHCSDGQ